MARNIPGKQQQAQDEGIEREQAQPGGSSGMPDDPNPRSLEVGGPKVKAGAPVEEKADAPPPEPSKRFRVVGGANPNEQGKFRVMYDGMPLTVALGKEYDEHQCDLDHLRRQGIRFEQVAPVG